MRRIRFDDTLIRLASMAFWVAVGVALDSWLATWLVWLLSRSTW
jgi:hypothetical protein